jgi:hypothetical protein
MVNNFKKELKKNRIAEIILLQVLQSVADDKIDFVDVTDNPDLYHYGDIMGTDKNGNVTFFDAKNDGIIAKTGRVFCESHKYFFNNMKRHSGYMEDGKYDYMCVVDRKSNKIYVLDFKVLKSIYKDYKEVQTTLSDAYSYGTVIPLDECRKEKALIYTITYDGDDTGYYALDVKNEQKYGSFLF